MSSKRAAYKIKGFALAKYYQLAVSITNQFICKKLNTEILNLDLEDCKYSNSVFASATFKIAEIPDWKWGIWLTPEEALFDEEAGIYSLKKVNRIHISLFTQFEKSIDKFKPTRSAYLFKFNYSIDILKDILTDKKSVGELIAEDISGSCFELDEACKAIKFIKKYPALAFYRDYFDADFNIEHVSNHKANKELKRFLLDHKRTESLQIWANKKQKAFLQKVFNESSLSDQFILHDFGANWYPRYEATVPYRKEYDKKFGLSNGAGWYYLWDFFAPEVETDYQKLINQIRKKFKKYNCYFSDEFSDSLCFANKKQLKNIKLKKGLS